MGSSFPVSNANSLLRILEPTTWNLDLDIAEYLLNYTMPRELRSSVSVELTPIFPKFNAQCKVWRRWNYLMMGFTTSSYAATQGSVIAEEVVRGDSLDPVNVLF